MKFLHAADLHLDSPMHGLAAYDGAPVDELRGATRRALEHLVDLALEEQVAFVLIAGDVYDGSWRDFNTGLFYVAQMRRLREAGIPVVAIAGNHDAESRMTKQLPLPEGYTALSSRKPQTIVLDDLGVAIHGQSFATAAVTDDLSAAYPAPRPGVLNIGLLHTSAGGRPGHENYAPCSVDALVAHGYDYWALGHVHGREVLHEEPWVVFPGNVQGRHARETGPKGATLVTVDDGRIVAVEHRDLDVVRWASCVVDAADCGTPDEVAIAAVNALEAHVDAAESRFVAARVTVEGVTDAHAAVTRDPDTAVAAIRARALDVHGDRVWLEKVRLRTRPKVDVGALRGRDDATGEVLRTVDRIDNDLLSTLAAGFADLQAKLPAGTDVDPTDLTFLREALGDVERLLVAHLESGAAEGSAT
jgi:DNA repair exonuclease SbcCD nuclease subunit